MPHKHSKLDPYRDQILLWRLTMDTRAIEKKLRVAPYGLAVTHQQIGNKIRAWTQSEASKVSQRAVEITAVTKDLIESKWGTQLAEWETNYFAAKKDEDRDGMALWSARWQKAVETGVARFFPQPQTLVQQNVQVNTVMQTKAEAMRELIESLPPEVRDAVVKALRE